MRVPFKIAGAAALLALGCGLLLRHSGSGTTEGDQGGSATASAAALFVPADTAWAVHNAQIIADSATLASFRSCRVTSVTDGDTFRCDQRERVRLLLIDTPEMDQGEWGSAAKRVLRGFIPAGTQVKLEMDVQKQDRYGRTLAYVYLPDGRQINELMALSGYAEVLVYPPNVRHVEVIRRAREAARRARRGLWAVSAFACTPRDHRAKRCQ